MSLVLLGSVCPAVSSFCRWPPRRSAPPARVAVARAGGPLLAWRSLLTAVDGRHHCAHEPRIDRQALAVGALLDLALELVWQPQVDPRGAALSGRGPLRCSWPTRRSAQGYRSARASSRPAAPSRRTRGSPPRKRSSTEPGARSLVISAVAVESASSRVSRTADSSAAVNRCASDRASSPPAEAATASCSRELVCVRFRVPWHRLWHHYGTMSSAVVVPPVAPR